MNGDDDERSPFEDAMADVRPLREGPPRVPPPRPRHAGPAREAPSPGFESGRDERGIWGLAPGVDRALLRALREGRPESGQRVDLHGLDEGAARQRVERALRAAHAEGTRCVALVHGRGLHSAGAPVLREALPGWLGSAPLAPLVLAYAPAPPREGGEGVTRVLLRRTRSDAP